MCEESCLFVFLTKILFYTQIFRLKYKFLPYFWSIWPYSFDRVVTVSIMNHSTKSESVGRQCVILLSLTKPQRIKVQRCTLQTVVWQKLHTYSTAVNADRLADFYIRVGQIFNRATFDPTNYTQCAHQSTVLGSSETKMFTCDQPISGRFVTVHFPTTRTEVLTLCEVAVYELNQGNLLAGDCPDISFQNLYI